MALEQGIRYRTIFLILMGTILAIAATNVLAGTVGLVRETRSRPLTAVEQARYIQEDIAARWHNWPADLVFPVELQYIGLGRVQQYARRVGLAPEVACAAGVDAPVGSVLTEYGCRTLLRATYVDQTSSFAFTVGIAVLASEEKRIAAAGQLAVDDRVGVRPVAFPGTATERFGAAQRQRNSWVASAPTSSSPPPVTPTAVPASHLSGGDPAQRALADGPGGRGPHRPRPRRRAQRRSPVHAGERVLRRRRVWAAGALIAVSLTVPTTLAAPVAAADVREDQRWVLEKMNVEQAWKVTKGAGVTVALVDSGVDDEVAELRGRVISGPNMGSVEYDRKDPGAGRTAPRWPHSSPGRATARAAFSGSRPRPGSSHCR